MILWTAAVSAALVILIVIFYFISAAGERNLPPAGVSKEKSHEYETYLPAAPCGGQ